MKRQGFIYIFTVIVISILALIFYFSYSYVTNSSTLTKSIYESELINYRLESLMNLNISDENFERELEKFYATNYEEITLNAKNIFSDVDKFTISVERKGVNSDNFFKIIGKIKYKEDIKNSTYRCNLINKIYKNKNGIVNSADFTIDELVEYKDKIDNYNLIGGKNKIIRLRGDFKIRGIRGVIKIYEEITEIVEGVEEKRENEIYTLNLGDILIQDEGSLEFIGNMTDSIYYILGSNVRFNDNKISGIIYLKNSNIEGDFKLNGYLIDIYDIMKKDKIEYDEAIIKKFHKNLPNFFKFSVDSIKI